MHGSLKSATFLTIPFPRFFRMQLHTISESPKLTGSRRLLKKREQCCCRAEIAPKFKEIVTK